MLVGSDKVVTIEYTLTDPGGQVIDTSKGGQPMAYLHGRRGIIPGLEAALDGKSPGDLVDVTIQPEHAYGPRQEQLIQPVPRERFPASAKIVPGMQFQAQTPEGARLVTVVSADETSVRIDANHPLAGIPLHFVVTIVEVRNATAEELQHGHAHGAGGHHHH